VPTETASEEEIRGADLLLVGDPADAVIQAVRQVCHRRRKLAKGLSRRELARSVTIKCDDGGQIVEPDRPTLLRRDPSGGIRSRDETFIRSEEYAQLWAACALMKSPVINRPAMDAFLDADRRLAIVTLARLDSGPSSFVPDESYISTINIQADALGDVDNLCTDFVVDIPATGLPHRIRPSASDGWVYVQVTVVGDRSWIRNDSYGNLDWLRDQSLLVGRLLGLQFLSVFWRAWPMTFRAELMRVQTCPTGPQLDSQLEVVAETLVDLLLG